jgi:GDP/UDP-N,N'-diacetylbacillosamine 2-epimerase (hydrolysing)
VTTRRIAVVTGSRADFGLLSRVISGLVARPEVICQVIVTGSHLSTAHGETAIEIEAAGVRVAWRIDLELREDTAAETGKAMGRALAGFAEAYDALRPDLIVVLGDRYEILAAACAAAISSIPIAHIHGGELSEGATDDALRHAITKLSHLHFVAAESYRQRVIQMGEEPNRVVLVGGMGVDLARHTLRMTRAALERDTGFVFGARNLIVTFHPVTLVPGSGEPELDSLLVFTLPNADVGNLHLREKIVEFVRERSWAWAFPSLGYVRYLSFVATSDGVIGNSSSGLIEAPSLSVGTVNIGNRQNGRLRASSVIDCPADRGAICAALVQLLSPAFRAALAPVRNPYGGGGGAEAVVRVLTEVELEGLVIKHFIDVPDPALAELHNG